MLGFNWLAHWGTCETCGAALGEPCSDDCPDAQVDTEEEE